MLETIRITPAPSRADLWASLAGVFGAIAGFEADVNGNESLAFDQARKAARYGLAALAEGYTIPPVAKSEIARLGRELARRF